jgi:hypothetical protein
VDDGLYLIEAAGPDPVARLMALPAESLQATAANWDLVLRKQGVRLDLLSSYLFGDKQLPIIDTRLREALGAAIGSKMQRAVTLHGIGSNLVLRLMLPLDDSPEDIARLVRVMAGERGRSTLNMKRIRREVQQLRSALEGYRTTLDRLVPPDELIRLDKRARKETAFRLAKK